MPLHYPLRPVRAFYALTYAVVVWAVALVGVWSLPLLVSAITPSFPQPESNASTITPSAPALDQSNGSNASYNWAGYSAKGSFTGVSGSWTVPVVTGERIVSSDATWVGIGGVNTTDLLQAGTHAMVENGEVTYHAWYERLPEAMRYVPLAVHAGDEISSSIIEERPGVWQIRIVNATTGRSFSTQVSYDSSHSTASWIEERPSLEGGGILPLAQFGSVAWHSALALQNGAWTPLSNLEAEPITMLSHSGGVLAQPSGLSGSGFAVSQPSSAHVASSGPHPVPPPQMVQSPLPIPLVALMFPDPRNSDSASIAETSSSAAGTHGSYYVYVNGKLVEQRNW